MRRVARVLFFAVVALIGGCGASYRRAPEAPIPRGAVRISNAGEYRAWWEQVEGCSGRRGDFRSVSLYVVFDRGEGIPFRGTLATALAYPQKRAIVLTFDAVLDSFVVRHEFLHLLASPSDHSPTYYQRQCAHLVSCTAHCLLNIQPQD